MHQLLSRLLKKRGIEKIEQLDQFEMENFKRWEKALNPEDITIDKLTEFIKEQKSRAEDNIANPENTKDKDMFLKASLNIYKALLGLIDSPKVGKEQIGKHLEQLINQ